MWLIHEVSKMLILLAFKKLLKLCNSNTKSCRIQEKVSGIQHDANIAREFMKAISAPWTSPPDL